MNSPVFSKDQFEHEGELKERLCRRSLGSSDGGDLQGEIKKALEEGRLQLNIHSPKGDESLQVEGFGNDDRKVFATKNVVESCKKDDELLMNNGASDVVGCNNETKLSRKPTGMGCSDGSKRENISENSLGKLKNGRREHPNSTIQKNTAGAGANKDRRDVQGSSRRLQKTGTYALKVEGNRTGNVDNDDSKADCPEIDKNQSLDGKEDNKLSSHIATSSSRPGTYVLHESSHLAGLEKNEDVKSHEQPETPKPSPRNDAVCGKAGKNTDKDSKTETLKKFRRGFDKQRIGFFVDLGNDDSTLEKGDPSDQHQIRNEEDLEINFNSVSDRNANSQKNENINMQSLLPEVCIRTSNRDDDTVTNVCNNNQEALSMPAFNNSTVQSMDNAVSTQSCNDNINLVKNTGDGSEKVLDRVESTVFGPDSRELGRTITTIGQGNVYRLVSKEDLDFPSGNLESIIHRRALLSPIEVEKKSRYSSWDITPDTEKEVLGKITSLKDCGSSHSTSEEVIEVFDPVNVEEVQVHRYVNDDVVRGTLQPQRRECGYFFVGYESVKEKGPENKDFSGNGVDCKRKKPTKKGDYFVIGEEFNADEVRSKRRSSEQGKGKETLDDGMKQDSIRIVRKSTFVIRSVDDSAEIKTEGRNEELAIVDSDKKSVKSSSNDFEQRRIDDMASKTYPPGNSEQIVPVLGQNIDSCRDSEPICRVDSIKASISANANGNDGVKEDREAGYSCVDSRLDRASNDEAVVEDYDLYVSNGSRPASGVSNHQDQGQTEELTNRALSVISSTEDVVFLGADDKNDVSHDRERSLPVGRCGKDDAAPIGDLSTPTEPYDSRIASGRKNMERQLSDTEVSISHKLSTRSHDGYADISFGKAHEKPVRYFERQHSENLMDAHRVMQGCRENLVKYRESGSLSSLESNLRMSPFKAPRTDRRQNFGHRPMSYDVTRKPLLERLERLCSFMSKSLTKLNSMNDGESEIVSKLDKVHGKEDFFIRSKAASSSYAEPGCIPTEDGICEKERIQERTVLPSYQESFESFGEPRSDFREAQMTWRRDNSSVMQNREFIEPAEGENLDGDVFDDGFYSRNYENVGTDGFNSVRGVQPGQFAPPWRAQWRQGLLLVTKFPFL